MSPEDLFRQFFGGGMGGGFGGPFGRFHMFATRASDADPATGGGIFDTGPGFVFNVGGGPGVRVHQFGGGRPRRRPATAQPPGSEQTPNLASTFTSLLPLLLLFILPLLSSLFSGSSTPSGPSIVFDGPKPPYTQTRISNQLKVPYFVKPTDVEDYSAKLWRKLDTVAETRYLHQIGRAHV